MLARELHLPVSVMLRSMSALELSEWQAFLSLEARVQRQVQQGMDPVLADKMIWSIAEDAEPARPKRKIKGKG